MNKTETNIDVSPTRDVDLPEIASITREVHPDFIADKLGSQDQPLN